MIVIPFILLTALWAIAVYHLRNQIGAVQEENSKLRERVAELEHKAILQERINQTIQDQLESVYRAARASGAIKATKVKVALNPMLAELYGDPSVVHATLNPSNGMVEIKHLQPEPAPDLFDEEADDDRPVSILD